MAMAHFDVSLAYDQIVKRGVPGQVARVSDADTDLPYVELLDLDGNPLAGLVSNSQGYVPPFQIQDGPALVKMLVGGVTYYLQDLNLFGETATAAQDAAADAQKAAGLVEAPADDVISTLVGNDASQTATAGDARWVTQISADARYPALLNGVVSTTQLPAATNIDRGILSLGQVASAAADTVSAAMSSAVNLDELQHNILIDSYRGVNTSVPNGIATILYAPYKMRITRLSLIFDVWSKAVSETDYASFTLRRYDPLSNTGASIVVKHTSQEAVTTRKPWNFDAVTWNAGTAVIEAGQAVSLGWANQGGSIFTLPMLVSIGVEPV